MFFQNLERTNFLNKHIKHISFTLLMVITRKFHFQNESTSKLKLKFQIFIYLNTHPSGLKSFLHMYYLLIYKF
jgi:hypothetical protein